MQNRDMKSENVISFFFHLFSHNTKSTPFTTKYKNKIIIKINIKMCGKTDIIDDSNKIFLVQR